MFKSRVIWAGDKTWDEMVKQINSWLFCGFNIWCLTGLCLYIPALTPKVYPDWRIQLLLKTLFFSCALYPNILYHKFLRKFLTLISIISVVANGPESNWMLICVSKATTKISKCCKFFCDFTIACWINGRNNFLSEARTRNQMHFLWLV